MSSGINSGKYNWALRNHTMKKPNEKKARTIEYMK